MNIDEKLEEYFQFIKRYKMGDPCKHELSWICDCGRICAYDEICCGKTKEIKRRGQGKVYTCDICYLIIKKERALKQKHKDIKICSSKSCINALAQLKKDRINILKLLKAIHKVVSHVLICPICNTSYFQEKIPKYRNAFCSKECRYKNMKTNQVGKFDYIYGLKKVIHSGD